MEFLFSTEHNDFLGIVTGYNHKDNTYTVIGADGSEEHFEVDITVVALSRSELTTALAIAERHEQNTNEEEVPF
jgi:hypothetical protein